MADFPRLRQVRQKGEKSPHRQVYLIQSWAGCVGWHSAAARCGRGGWRQPVESDNIAFLLMPTSSSRHGESRGWPHFCLDPQLEIIIIESGIINSEILVNPRDEKLIFAQKQR